MFPPFRALALLGLLCAAVLLNACGDATGPAPTTSGQSSTPTKQSGQAGTTTTQAAPAGAKDPDGGNAGHGDPKRPTWRPLGNTKDGFGFDRRYVQVTTQLSDDQLVEEARSMRGQYPKGWFWMLDDDARFPAMWANLRTPTEPAYPLEWVQQHTVANVALELDGRGGRTWVLYKGTSGSDKIADLAEAECGKTVSSCT